MAEGWIRIHRSLGSHELWLSEPFTRGQAWVDLVLLAKWKDCYVRIRGAKVWVKRGQLVASLIWLSQRWSWSRGKVRRFLDELETVQQIVQQKNNLTTIVTITNYQHYQSDGHETDTKQDTKRTADGHTIRKDKKVKKVKKNNTIAQNDVIEIYDAYPKKIGKAKALKAIHKALEKINHGELLSAVKEYAKCRAGPDQKFTPYPATWFNQERWNDDRTEWKSDGRSGKRRVGSGEDYQPGRKAKL